MGIFLLTGASGFVGKGILNASQLRDINIRPVYRSIDSAEGRPNAVVVSGLEASTDWTQALHDVDVVIHCAARVQALGEGILEEISAYRSVNVEGTLNLARQAVAAGVRRFVFISTIKVNGETTMPGRPFTADDTPAPEDAYGVSKAEAESKLRLLAKKTGIEVTIIRPPLIYGPGVKGNFASLISFVRKGIPLPLGSVTQNRRSFVGLHNLVDLILVCTDHPKAANQTFLISDGEDLSTAELLRKIGNALGRSTRLLWLPPGAISFMVDLMGKKGISQRLLGSLQVDIHKTRELLDWKPSVGVDEGLRKTVE